MTTPGTGTTQPPTTPSPQTSAQEETQATTLTSGVTTTAPQTSAQEETQATTLTPGVTTTTPSECKLSLATFLLSKPF